MTQPNRSEPGSGGSDVGHLLPNMSQVMQAHRAQIPAATRQQKAFLSLFGVALGLCTYVGQTKGAWPTWAVMIGYYLAGHFAAGDYRRLIIRQVAAAAKDATRLARILRDVAVEAWAAVKALKGDT